MKNQELIKNTEFIEREWEDFFSDFNLVGNHFDQSSEHEGFLFRKDNKEEYEYVLSVFMKTPRKVWSAYCCDGMFSINDGMHTIDVDGYFISKEDALPDSSYIYIDNDVF